MEECGDGGMYVIIKSDQDAAIQSLMKEVVEVREDTNARRTIIEQAPVGSSGSSGVVERAAQTIEGQIHVMKSAFEGLWPSAIMASSSRRAFIGHLILAKAAEARGDRMTPSRPPLTATSMIGHSGALLEHLVHPAVCKTVRMNSKAASRFTSCITSWNLLFSQMGYNIK